VQHVRLVLGERKANERRPPAVSRILIVLALIRRSGHPGKGGRGGEDKEKGTTAFSRGAATTRRRYATRRDAMRRENRLTSRETLSQRFFRCMRLIIYRTTDRSTPCWIIRGSSVDHPWTIRSRRRERKRKIKLIVPDEFDRPNSIPRREYEQFRDTIELRALAVLATRQQYGEDNA